MSKQGWVSIHRSIYDNWLWDEKPFSKGQAWIDILLMANFQDNKFLLGNTLVTVKKGSFITSELKLMDRWGWSKAKVRCFLKLLESDGMLIKNSDRKKTTLTVVNYSDYQDLPNHRKTTEEPQKDRGETTEEPQKDTNNNVNNANTVNKGEMPTEKSIKHKFGDYGKVRLDDEQFLKLKNEFPDDWEARIQKLDDYVASTGKSYKDHLATIRNWAKRDGVTKKDKPVTNNPFLEMAMNGEFDDE